MKIHRAWIHSAAAAAIMAFGSPVAVGQYASYPPTPAAPRYANQQHSNVAPYGVQPMAQAPSIGTAQPAPYPTTQPVAYPAVPAVQGVYPVAPQYPQVQRGPMQPSYPAVARRPNGENVPMQPQGDAMLPTPAEAGLNGNGTNLDPSANGGYQNAGNCNCTSYQNPGDYYGGPGNYGYPDYGVGAYMDGYDGGGTKWFGGVYGLCMTRSEPADRRFTVGVDSVAEGVPYYPLSNTTENFLHCGYLEPDWREGIEVRLGCAFSICDDYGADSCGYGYGCGNDCGSCGNNCNSCQSCCCPQTYAIEVGYWGIDRDVQDQFVDGPITGTFRYYGMVNYAGLEYDPGSGAVPVNTYYNYQIPITGTGDGPGGERVVAQRVRTNFWAQNLELNVLRLPLLAGGCGSCDPCGCDPCCDSCAPPFTLTGLCGIRWFRVDDDLEFGTEWSDTAFDGFDYESDNELFHDIQVENNLIGFQLGANMNYCVAARWNFFWDTNFGLYNNYITHWQRIYNGLDLPVTFIQEGREADVRSHKNDVAFLGEMRLGGAYNFTAHCRGVLAYRAIAISGVALAPEQIKPEYSNWADTAQIDADGSIIIHGVQSGIEFCY